MLERSGDLKNAEPLFRKCYDEWLKSELSGRQGNQAFSNSILVAMLAVQMPKARALALYG